MPAKKSKNSGFLNVHKQMSKGQLVLIALVFGLVGGFVLRSSYAAPHRPGGGGTSTISAPIMVTDTGTAGLSFGDTITFSISTTATANPYVNVLCYQNGVLVMNSWNGFFDTALNPTRNFALYSPSWKSGAAECTAWLDSVSKKTTQLASVSFHVNP